MFLYQVVAHWFVLLSEIKNCCDLCTVKAKEAYKSLKQRTLSSFILSFRSVNHATMKTEQKQFKGPKDIWERLLGAI